MLLFSLNLFSQGAGESKTASANYLEILLIITSILLVFVIWMLSQILITLSRMILHKNNRGVISKSLMIILMSSIFAGTASSQSSTLITGFTTSKNYGGINAIDFYVLSIVLGIEIVVVLFLAFMVRRSFKDLSGEVHEAYVKKAIPHRYTNIWRTIDKKWLTRAIPIEKEADFLLDHDYDGIRELDNALPPWWKYGFYVTLVVAVIYMFNFHVWDIGKNPEQEYAAEMEAGRKDEELYKMKTKNLVDENNVKIDDVVGIEAGKLLFMQACIACHGTKGEGGIGPNLTDDYWIHGGSMNKIYQTIKIGYPEKGMQAWQSIYSPIQIKNLSSFVKSLKGSKPQNPKSSQGELYLEKENNNPDSSLKPVKLS